MDLGKRGDVRHSNIAREAHYQGPHRVQVQVRSVERWKDEVAVRRGKAALLHHSTSVGYHQEPMATHSPNILELARKGATHTYQELKAELAALVKAFPHLRYGSAVSPAMPDEAARRPARRRKMSAAARAKISAAQKKRWAKQKANDKK